MRMCKARYKARYKDPKDTVTIFTEKKRASLWYET